MRVLVFPHSMELGGSQTNAVELAAGVRDRGHDVVVYADDGPMLDRVAALGLTHLRRHPARLRPGAGTALHLRGLVRELGIDVLHGYEWPPALECWGASRAPGGPTPATVATVMSMAVAPFLPRAMPLVVGTETIRRSAAAGRSGPVVLLEPPVDVRANAPGLDLAPPSGLGLAPDALTVVAVSRLAPELKLEGLLSAISAVDLLAAELPVQLLIVGDGPAGDRVRAAAREVNDRHNRACVVVAGEHRDPRWAYAAADVCLGMGGSALRGAAFGAPLVVQGEGGFFATLTEATLPQFLTQGWYGVGPDPTAGPARLVACLRPLLAATLRARLGAFARQVVLDRFSLDAAAELQERVYLDAVAARRRRAADAADAVRSGWGVAGHQVRRRVARSRGRLVADDFNARPA